MYYIFYSNCNSYKKIQPQLNFQVINLLIKYHVYLKNQLNSMAFFLIQIYLYSYSTKNTETIMSIIIYNMYVGTKLFTCKYKFDSKGSYFIEKSKKYLRYRYNLNCNSWDPISEIEKISSIRIRKRLIFLREEDGNF